MKALETVIRLEVYVLLCGLAAVVLYKIMTGAVRVGDLLVNEGGRPSPGRVQLLFVILIAAFYYLVQVLHDPSKVPVLPDELLYILGGSNALLLGRRYYSATRL